MLKRLARRSSSASSSICSSQALRRRELYALAPPTSASHRQLSVSTWRHSLINIQATSTATSTTSTVITGSKPFPAVWFTGFTPPLWASAESSGDGSGGEYSSSLSTNHDRHGDYRPPDERTLQLGKTLRILRDRLPTLLQTPLPQEILSPQITLHLFPSTHPHLPTVTGRVAYVAALWTAPVVWGRVPIFGNVKLEILSERMMTGPGGGPAQSGHRLGSPFASSTAMASKTARSPGNERLVVRWRTIGKSKTKDTLDDTSQSSRDSTSSPSEAAISKSRASSLIGRPKDTIKKYIGNTTPNKPKDEEEDEDHVEEVEEDDREFEGRFIFTFDEKGRIHSHTIEHAEDDPHETLNNPTLRQITLVDWLLGKLGGGNLGGLQGAATSTITAAGAGPGAGERPRSSRLRWRGRMSTATARGSVGGLGIGDITIIPSSHPRATPITVVAETSYSPGPTFLLFPSRRTKGGRGGD